MIPLCRPHVTEEDIAVVAAVLRSGHWAGGPLVRDFEADFAAAMGVPHACALNSCASALQLAFEVLPQKGEVILPSFTFAASANAVVRAGFDPVFVDVEPYSGNLDHRLLAQCVSSKTVAVMPVHFAGLACDMDPIMAFCAERGLAVVEDCAEAVGARYAGRYVGSFGIGCFSFFPTKNMSTGEGGMFTCDDAAVDARVRRLRGHGVVRTAANADWRRDVAEPGFNYRLTDIQAALGISQLRRLEWMNVHRRALAERYARNLQTEENVTLPVELPGREHVYQMYVVRVDPARRDEVVRGLRAKGIEASVHFDPPLHRTQAYGHVPAPAGLSATDRLSSSVISLPMSAVHSVDDVDAVCAALLESIS